MSLTLLPAVDVRDGKAVRLRQGESGSETDYGSPLEAARTWVESGAEWIHLVDLDAAFGTGNNRDQLRAIVKELGDKVNIEMSGGVRDDASLDAALEAGAADFAPDEGVYTVYTDPDDVASVAEALTNDGYELLSAQVEMVPQNTIKLTDEGDIKNLQKMLDMFEDNEDVQNVWHNWEE